MSDYPPREIPVLDDIICTPVDLDEHEIQLDQAGNQAKALIDDSGADAVTQTIDIAPCTETNETVELNFSPGSLLQHSPLDGVKINSAIDNQLMGESIEPVMVMDVNLVSATEKIPDKTTEPEPAAVIDINTITEQIMQSLIPEIEQHLRPLIQTALIENLEVYKKNSNKP